MLLYNLLKYSRGNYVLHYGRFSLSLDCCVPILGSSPPDLFSHNTDCSPNVLDRDLAGVPLSTHVEADVRQVPRCASETHLGLWERSSSSDTHKSARNPIATRNVSL